MTIYDLAYAYELGDQSEEDSTESEDNMEIWADEVEKEQEAIYESLFVKGASDFTTHLADMEYLHGSEVSSDSSGTEALLQAYEIIPGHPAIFEGVKIGTGKNKASIMSKRKYIEYISGNLESRRESKRGISGR